MAQRIWLIRHGKSSRPFGVVDHQRSLSKRASADAALVRAYLGDEPELYVSSTARRALETADLLAGKRPVQPEEELYQGSTSEFMKVIEVVANASDRPAFVAHNPTITALVNRLAGRIVTDSVPTLGVASFEREKTGWRLVDYITPKALR